MLRPPRLPPQNSSRCSAPASTHHAELSTLGPKKLYQSLQLHPSLYGDADSFGSSCLVSDTSVPNATLTHLAWLRSSRRGQSRPGIANSISRPTPRSWCQACEPRCLRKKHFSSFPARPQGQHIGRRYGAWQRAAGSIEYRKFSGTWTATSVLQANGAIVQPANPPVPLQVHRATATVSCGPPLRYPCLPQAPLPFVMRGFLIIGLHRFAGRENGRCHMLALFVLKTNGPSKTLHAVKPPPAFQVHDAVFHRVLFICILV